MDINKYLIIVKDEDKTEDIHSYKYKNGKCYLTYKGSREYAYSDYNVEIYQIINCFNESNYESWTSISSSEEIEKIQEFAEHYRVWLKNGYRQLFPRGKFDFSNICVKKPNHQKHETKDIINSRFSYFKALAYIDPLVNIKGKSILGNSYDFIKKVHEVSILKIYLQGTPFINQFKKKSKDNIYPFSFNLSQIQAIENALCNRVSVIEGPPGTGKTQTILNIIAYLVSEGKSIAVVSNNNSATKNILDKLEKYDLGFIAAYLGNVENKDIFISEQKDIPSIVKTWKLENIVIKNIKTKQKRMKNILINKLENFNQLSRYRQELDKLKTEQKHFIDYYNTEVKSDINNKFLSKLSSKDILKLIVRCDQIEDRRYRLKEKIYNFLRYQIYSRKLYKMNIYLISLTFQKSFYEIKAKELLSLIHKLEKTLVDFEEQMKEFTDLSMKLFRSKISDKYNYENRKKFDAKTLKSESKVFIKEYPVILSTTHSLRNSLDENFIYDYIIIDEASQVNLTTSSLAFSCAKNAVIVGDSKQLPNVVDAEMKKRTDSIYNLYTVPEQYCYSKHSILSSLNDLFPQLPKVMLREHYRCSPKIIEFCNKRYYNEELIILTKEESDKKNIYIYETAAGNHARDRMNIRQIDVIREEIIPQLKLNPQIDSIGIVTPYRRQTEELQKEFKGTLIEADTVDRFQGREKDTIIISTVDNEISEFASDDNRLNVAVSRAVKNLVLLVNKDIPNKKSGIHDLMNYIRYNNGEVFESKLRSIFDILYKSCREEKLKARKRFKRISEFDSENIFFDLISSILLDDEFKGYVVNHHVSLKSLIKDYSILDNGREWQYAMNDNTHVDFVISDKFSHLPLLLFEVQGYMYHKEGTDQHENDKIKKGICEKYNLKLVEVWTNELVNREKVIDYLRMIN